MAGRLKVLMVEDSEDDAYFIQELIRKADYDLTASRVDSAGAMRTALTQKDWDLVLSDHSMPGFSAPAALSILQESGIDIPFIIVSGEISEDMALSLIRAGAHDFVMKDRLGRLVPAMERELTQARDRQQLRLQAAALESAANGIVITDREGVIEWVNPAFAQMTGYSKEETLGNTLGALINSGKHEAMFFKVMWQTILRGETWYGNMVNRRQDGSLYHEAQTITPVTGRNGDITHFVAIKLDVTARMEAEEQVAQKNRELTALNQLFQAHLRARDEMDGVLASLSHSMHQVAAEASNISNKIPV